MVLMSVHSPAVVHARKDPTRQGPIKLVQVAARTHAESNPTRARHRLAGTAGHTGPELGIGRMTVIVAACLGSLLAQHVVGARGGGARAWVQREFRLAAWWPVRGMWCHGFTGGRRISPLRNY